MTGAFRAAPPALAINPAQNGSRNLRLYVPMISGNTRDAAHASPNVNTGSAFTWGASPWGRCHSFSASNVGLKFTGRGFAGTYAPFYTLFTLFKLNSTGGTARLVCTSSGDSGNAMYAPGNQLGWLQGGITGAVYSSLPTLVAATWYAAAIARDSGGTTTCHLFNFETGAYASQSLSVGNGSAGDSAAMLNSQAGGAALNGSMALGGIQETLWSGAEFLKWVADPFAPLRIKHRLPEIATASLSSTTAPVAPATIRTGERLGATSVAAAAGANPATIRTGERLGATSVAVAAQSVQVRPATIPTGERLGATAVGGGGIVQVRPATIRTGERLGAARIAQRIFTPLLVGLVARLKASPELAAIVGSRIFPDHIPQREALPAACYRQISSTEDTNIDGGCGVVRARVQITFRAKQLATAQAAAEATRQRISNYSGLMYGVKVRVCLWKGEVILAEDPADGTDARTFDCAVDYSFTYDRPVAAPVAD